MTKVITVDTDMRMSFMGWVLKKEPWLLFAQINVSGVQRPGLATDRSRCFYDS